MFYLFGAAAFRGKAAFLSAYFRFNYWYHTRPKYALKRPKNAQITDKRPNVPKRTEIRTQYRRDMSVTRLYYAALFIEGTPPLFGSQRLRCHIKKFFLKILALE